VAKNVVYRIKEKIYFQDGWKKEKKEIEKNIGEVFSLSAKEISTMREYKKHIMSVILKNDERDYVVLIVLPTNKLNN
jgi:hypothetical protein|tara:strand:- start:203 stop:433 length:231 start_codon:yes stop_codon:yes gene_type:complete